MLASKCFRAIRNGNPEADIHLLTSTEAYPIARTYGHIDKVWAFPIRELRRNRLQVINVLKLILAI